MALIFLMKVNMNKNIRCLIFLLPIIAGCAIKKSIKPTEFLQQQEIIAKYADLPDAPFQLQLQKIAVSEKAHEQVQLFYTFAGPVEDLVSFYEQQMERLGWDLFARSDVQDYLLHFNKPDLLCSVLISQDHLSIYMSNKKGA